MYIGKIGHESLQGLSSDFFMPRYLGSNWIILSPPLTKMSGFQVIYTI